MEFILMHKNIPVADMEILSETGRIMKLYNLQNPEHLPLSVNTKGGINHKAMDYWWTGRSIPASRDGLEDALSKLGLYSTSILATKCYGLSLSDQYWVCPKGSGLKWETVNFFHNNFSKDMGEILFGHDPSDLTSISLMSPDNTSDGWLRKKWIIADGKRCLMKGGSGDYQQEPLNEVIASAVMRRLDLQYVNYTLTFDEGKPYSLCENFITQDTELVPAWYVKEAFKKDNRDSDFTHLLRSCDALGISDVSVTLGKMLTLDYIISNEDRHYNNFGFVRNAETLKWTGLAPIYDSGTSLWYSTRFVGRSTECKPFKKTHADQIKLVSDLSWFNFDALQGIGNECAEIFSRSEAINDERRAALSAAVSDRCKQVELMRSGKLFTFGAIREKSHQGDREERVREENVSLGGETEQAAKQFTEDPTSLPKGGIDLNAAAVEAADNPNHERAETENTPQERNPDIRKVAKNRLGAGASIINAVPGHAYRGNVLAVIDNGPNKVVAMTTPADQDLIVVHEVPNDKAADLKAGVKAELTMGKDSLSAAPGRDSQEREHKQFKGR